MIDDQGLSMSGIPFLAVCSSCVVLCCDACELVNKFGYAYFGEEALDVTRSSGFVW